MLGLFTLVDLLEHLGYALQFLRGEIGLCETGDQHLVLYRQPRNRNYFIRYHRQLVEILDFIAADLEKSTNLLYPLFAYFLAAGFHRPQKRSRSAQSVGHRQKSLTCIYPRLTHGLPKRRESHFVS